MLFQIEQDMKLLGKIEKANTREAEIMKSVEGWVVGDSVYSKRWSPPRFGKRLWNGMEDESEK